jgi:tetratricopeptide (TPR) repeat protein
MIKVIKYDYKKILKVIDIRLALYLGEYTEAKSLDQSNKLNFFLDELAKNKNFKKADQLEKKIWALWNKHPSNNKLTERLELGSELMYQGSYNYALSIFNNIIRTDPNWSEAWNKRATLLFLMRDYPKSLKDIEKVLNIESRHFGALMGRAQIYIELKEYQKALKDLNKAKKMHPTIRGQNLIPEIKKLLKGLSV